jgi:hypothetical protein
MTFGVNFFTVSTPLANSDESAVQAPEAMVRHVAELSTSHFCARRTGSMLGSAARMLETVWYQAPCYHLQWRPDFKNQGSPTMNCN